MSDLSNTAEPAKLNKVREQAALWLVELEVQDEAAERKFNAWLAEDELHQKVFEQMQQMWVAVNPQHKKQARRRQLVAALSIAAIALLINWVLPWEYWRADYRTAVGEMAAINLVDGSKVTLNTNTAINVIAGDGHRPHIELIRGEVLLEVNKDDQRRFMVATQIVNAEALGTIYTVKKDKVKTKVRVFESSVAVTAVQSNERVVLAAGDEAVVVGGELNKKQWQIHNKSMALAPDWVQGSLVFNQEPLAEVVARLNQYHSGVLVLQGDHSQQQFTGVLPAYDSDAAIALLADTMKLQVSRLTSYLVVLK